jgi:hypothetical protein
MRQIPSHAARFWRCPEGIAIMIMYFGALRQSILRRVHVATRVAAEGGGRPGCGGRQAVAYDRRPQGQVLQYLALPVPVSDTVALHTTLALVGPARSTAIVPRGSPPPPAPARESPARRPAGSPMLPVSEELRGPMVPQWHRSGGGGAHRGPFGLGHPRAVSHGR